MGHRDIDSREAVTEQFYAEVRALFALGFAGEPANIKLPRVQYSGNPLKGEREVCDWSVADAIGDATCLDEAPATRALHAMLKPDADAVLCIGTFREAVIQNYIDSKGDDVIDVRLGQAFYDAAEDRAFTNARWAA